MTDLTKDEVLALAERTASHLAAGGRLFDFSLNEGDTIALALRAYAAGMEQEPVRVKALEFSPYPGNGERVIDGLTKRERKQRAVCPFGAYFITTKDGWWFVEMSFDHYGTSQGPTESDALAFAQADYEARILSALEPTVQPAESVAAVNGCTTASELEQLLWTIIDDGNPPSVPSDIVNAVSGLKAAAARLAEILSDAGKEGG